MNAKKAETSKRNLGSLQILHCLFHCGALLLFLLRQKKFDLLLYALKLLFFGIRERRVILQRKLAGIFTLCLSTLWGAYQPFLSAKKALVIGS